MSQLGERTDNHKTQSELIPSDMWGSEFKADAGLIGRNLSEIKANIAPCKPRIIGVTKYYGADSIIKGFEAGLRDFGESRVVEAVEKIKSLPEGVSRDSVFHFIGHLQTNKAGMAVEYFDYIHSVDSLKLASVVSKVACRLGKLEKIFLQVNNAGEEQKFGYTEAGLRQDLPEIMKLEGVEVVGLMNMATLGATEGLLHRQFSELRELRNTLQREFGIELPELSMGMSDDYRIAVSEGATMIRIGRKLFT